MRIGGSYNRAPVPASTGPSGSASRRRVCILLWRIKRRAPGDQDYGQKYAGESRVSHPIIVFGSNKDGQYTAFSQRFLSVRATLLAPRAIDLPGNQDMRIDAIAIGHNPPDDVNVIIEVPVGGQPIKYELDKDAGTLVVDRFLYTPMSYPGNYGFVPHTLSEDGDPIDVLVVNTRELVPACVINVRPVGVLIMEDNAGQGRKNNCGAVTCADQALR